MWTGEQCKMDDANPISEQLQRYRLAARFIRRLEAIIIILKYTILSITHKTKSPINHPLPLTNQQRYEVPILAVF